MAAQTGSRLLAQAQAYRDALEVGNQAAADRITRSWVTALERVDLEVQHLVKKMDAARLAGEPPSPAWLYQQRRLAGTTDRIVEELRRWAPMAEETIRDNAYAASARAQADAEGLVREAARVSLPGVEATFTDINPGNMATVLGHLTPGGPLADLLTATALEAVGAAEAAIVTGVTLGKGSEWITRNLYQALDVPRWRAETIARTEALRAYRETSRDTYQRSEVVGSWVWTSALDRRTCPACLVLHGQEFPLDEPLDGHPPCRCAMVPKTMSWADISPELADLPDTRPTIKPGKTWLGEQTPAVQRSILGPRKYDLLQADQITLDDLVARTHSPEWGTMRRERSVREMLEGRNPDDGRRAA